jgi:hypothetical protein
MGFIGMRRQLVCRLSTDSRRRVRESSRRATVHVRPKLVGR